jgi:phage major head subunit gpT-like protein
MAIITPQLLTALRTGYRADFQAGFDGAESICDRIATTVTSGTSSNTYGWLGQFPGFREWVGDRVLKDMAAKGYQIVNKDWESSVSVRRTDVEDDNLGIYSPMMREMGRAARVHPDELVAGLLKAGDSTLCYDGQNFFDSDHPVFPNVDGTGTPTTVSNIQTGSSPAWYLLDTSRALKPFIYQVRKQPIFTSMTSLEDESVFMRNEFRFGVDSRSNVGFGFWQQAFMSKAALTEANFNAAYTAMQSITADGGRNLNVRPSLLVVPPNLRTAALEITKADRKANGATNVNAGVVDVLVTSWVL